MPLADPLVPVDAAPERLLRVVQVKGSDVLEAEHPVHLFERLLVALIGGQVVAGREHVTRVDADPDALKGLDPLQKVPHVLEAMPEAGALPGGELDQDVRGLRGVGRARERAGDPLRRSLDPLCLPLPHVGSRMHDQVGNAEPRAAFELVDEGVERLPAKRPVGARQVDEVGVVRHQALAGHSPRTDRVAPALDRLVGERLRPPLALVPREDLHRLAAVGARGLDRPLEPPGDRLVDAEPHR